MWLWHVSFKRWSLFLFLETVFIIVWVDCDCFNQYSSGKCDLWGWATKDYSSFFCSLEFLCLGLWWLYKHSGYLIGIWKVTSRQALGQQSWNTGYLRRGTRQFRWFHPLSCQDRLIIWIFPAEAWDIVEQRQVNIMLSCINSQPTEPDSIKNSFLSC